MLDQVTMNENISEAASSLEPSLLEPKSLWMKNKSPCRSGAQSLALVLATLVSGNQHLKQANINEDARDNDVDRGTKNDDGTRLTTTTKTTVATANNAHDIETEHIIEMPMLPANATGGDNCTTSCTLALPLPVTNPKLSR